VTVSNLSFTNADSSERFQGCVHMNFLQRLQVYKPQLNDWRGMTQALICKNLGTFVLVAIRQLHSTTH
jgi:hypothetical protein